MTKITISNGLNKAQSIIKFLHNFISSQPTALIDQITSLHALIAVKVMRLNAFGSNDVDESAILEEKSQLLHSEVKNV